MIRNLIQRGHNSNYPKEITTWCPDTDMTIVPDWVNFRCRVKNIDDEFGNPILDYSKTSEGGYQFKGSDGVSIAFTTSSPGEYICYCAKEEKIFSLRPKQLDLLYIDK